MIDRKTVEEIAFLARLKLTDEEIDRFSKELGQIIEYFEQLKEVDVSNVKVTTNTDVNTDLLREDEIQESLSRTEFLKNAPKHIDGLLQVPAIFEESREKDKETDTQE